MIRLKSAGKTDVGLKREENEDNFIMLPDHGLYVLADGMGGHVGGKMASTLAVTLITEYVAVKAVKPDFEFDYEPDDSLPFEANVLVNAIKFANERIFIESCKDRQLEGMGTTVTAILATDEDLILAHVGDSRIYRLRDGDLEQMTVDHSLLNHMIEIGEIRADESHKFANKNVILRAVGLKDYVDVSARVVPKVPGDTYLMCSDGLSDLVEDYVIRKVLNTSESLPAAVNQLIKLALNAGGKDNITVVCVESEDVPVGEEQGWGTGTFTRKQNEAAAAAKSGNPPVARPTSGPVSSPRRVKRPSTPIPPPDSQPRPASPQSGQRRPTSQNRVNGRMHAVRTPVSQRRGSRAGARAQQRGDGMPDTPPRRSGGMPEPPRRRRKSNTPPAPVEAVDDRFEAQRPPRESRPQQGRRSDAGFARRASSPGIPAVQNVTPSGRRRTTPTDMPAYEPPETARPQSGPVTPPPPGAFEQPAPPPAPSRSQEGPSSGPDAGGPPPSRDTVKEMPIIGGGGQQTESRDTLKEMPIVKRGESMGAPAAEIEPEDSERATEMMIPQISRGQTAEGAEQDEERPTDPSMPVLEKAQVGDAEVPQDHPSYQQQGSVMVDSALFDDTETAEEESIVIDESLLAEVEEEEGKQKKPPPHPGSSERKKKEKREIGNRPTELLPISGRKNN